MTVKIEEGWYWAGLTKMPYLVQGASNMVFSPFGVRYPAKFESGRVWNAFSG